MKKKIAVIGAGIFGISVASKLAENNYVDIYEKESQILKSASGANQFRLHRGYYYPRSPENAKIFRASISAFLREFGKAVISSDKYYYCIAKYGSKTSAGVYLNFIKKVRLPYQVISSPLINPNSIDLCIKAQEEILDPETLKELCLKKLKNKNIRLFLSHPVSIDIKNSYDFVIVCTYANINKFIEKDSGKRHNFEFRVCEKPLIKLPKEFSQTSIMIFDGPFVSIAPYGRTKYHLFTDVVNAVHASNKGLYPLVPQKIQPLLNRGLIKNPPISNFELFVKSAERFMPEISKAKHIGSFFIIKTLLPEVEKKDERPTLINKIDKKVITVFSGKIVTCVKAAEKVAALINK